MSLFGPGQTDKFDVIIFGLPQQMSDKVKNTFLKSILKQSTYDVLKMPTISRKQKNIITGKEIQTKDTFSDKWNLL